MKKLQVLTAVILIFTLQVVAFQSSEAADIFTEGRWDALQKLELESSVKSLEKLDIVREPFEKWGKEDYISRRDIFKLVYIVKNGDRTLFLDRDEADELAELMGFDPVEHIELWKEHYKLWRQTEYVDVEPETDDYYLLYSLLQRCLIAGEESEEGYKANFDLYATYEQALTVLGRLFDEEEMYGELIIGNLVDKNKEHPYFHFACEIGLINSQSPIDFSCPQISVEQLGNPITAYEFMHMLYRALFIPHAYVSSFGVNFHFRYIESFAEINLDRDLGEGIDI